MKIKRAIGRSAISKGWFTTLIIASISLTGCSEEEIAALFDPSLGCGPTQEVVFTQDGQIATIDTIDLLFVTDTSNAVAQFNSNLVANAVPDFFNEMSGITAFNIGVILGHSPDSSNNGVLYDEGGTGPELFTEATANLSTVLRNRLANAPIETDTFINPANPGQPNGPGNPSSDAITSDSGELILNSLGNHYLNYAGSDLYQSSSATVLIFKTDEDAICAPGSTKQDFNEIWAPFQTTREGFARSKYCSNMNVNSILQSAIARNSVNIGGSMVQKSFLISMIANNDDPDYMAAYGVSAYDGENETASFGVGPLALAGNGKHQSVPISTDDQSVVDEKMKNLGKLMNLRLTRQTEFTIGDTDVAPKSLKVLVNGQEVASGYSPLTNQAQIRGFDPGSAGNIGDQIRVQYKATCK